MDEGYFSHNPVLSAAVLLTSGPVLELGTGYGSSLTLHGLCGMMKRKLVSIESDEIWLERFLSYERSWHKFRFASDFMNLPEYKEKWGLVFVDHGISMQRGHAVRMLKDTPIIVAHDTCHFFLYDYEPTLSQFKYRWDYKVKAPQTTVVSNSVNVAELFSEAKL